MDFSFYLFFKYFDIFGKTKRRVGPGVKSASWVWWYQVDPFAKGDLFPNRCNFSSLTCNRGYCKSIIHLVEVLLCPSRLNHCYKYINLIAYILVFHIALDKSLVFTLMALNDLQLFLLRISSQNPAIPYLSTAWGDLSQKFESRIKRNWSSGHADISRSWIRK